MAFEPINIFSHRIDPRGVVGLLRETKLDVEVVGPDDVWEQAVVVFPKQGFFRRARVLTFGHNTEYYDGPDWPRQVAGMQGYFSSFTDCPIKPEIMRLISTFRFSLAVPQHDLDINSSDERLKLVYAVCRHLDGVIFTPSSLRDADGRILLDADGNTDADGVLPDMPAPADMTALEEFDGEEDEEDDYEPDPPSAQRVARRVLALTAVAARATLELDAPNVENADDHRKRIDSWVREVGVTDELEPDEAKVVQRPVGTLDQRALINAMWRVEGLAVLAWSLRLHPLPPYDELVNPPDLYQATALFDAGKGQQLLDSADLRDSEELADLQEHLLAFHWRMRDYSLRAEPMDFVKFSEDCWFGSFDIDRFCVVDRDLAIGGVAISSAEEEEVQRAQSTAMERHLAINWLMGYSDVYSETDTST